MFGIEDEDAVHFAVGDKEPVIVVDGQAVDPSEVRLKAVADELGFVCFSVEDEDGSDSLIGHVDEAPGIESDAVGADELKRKSFGVEFFFLAFAAGETIHPGCLGLAGGGRGVIDLFAGEVVEPVDAGDVGRAGPHQLGGVKGEFARADLRGGGIGSLFFVCAGGVGCSDGQGDEEEDGEEFIARYETEL